MFMMACDLTCAVLANNSLSCKVIHKNDQLISLVINNSNATL